MSHHCIDWIPSELALNANLFWTLDFGVPEMPGPKIWVEHGIPDNHVIGREQFHDDVHYLFSNDWTYGELFKRGLKAYHVGHIFLDKTTPSRRNPNLLVYVPQHCRMEHHSLPLEWNHEPKTREELNLMCIKYKCDDFVTSIVDDTDRSLYNDLNPMISNRYWGMGMGHFKKCKFLYENAKVVYTDIMSTFDITAEAHGIKVVGRGKQKMPRDYKKVGVLTDGKSCTRIIDTMKDILNEFS
jgi:hypothetical protein